MWKTNAFPGDISPLLDFEFAGNKAGNIFGIWSGSDSSAIVTLDLLLGPAQGLNDANHGTHATLEWNLDGTLDVTGDAGTNAVTNFAGINRNGFGFYLKDPSGTIFYSVDDLNLLDPKEHFVAYQNGQSSNWVLGIEDVRGGDNDFNDMVVKVESIDAVPEPAAIAFLGTALLACVGLVRRRRLS
jgi:hypothetical protein